MKKFTNILENEDKNDFIRDIKNLILDVFDNELSIKTSYVRSFIDINGVELLSLNYSFYKKLNNNTHLSYNKLFNLFYKYEIEFEFNNNTLTSNGTLGEYYEILNELKLEIDSKKYNI